MFTNIKLLSLFFKILFIYSRETQRKRQRHRQREEKQGLCREPDAGLDLGTPGSHPEPKADAQPLSHPGVLSITYSCKRPELLSPPRQKFPRPAPEEKQG